MITQTIDNWVGVLERTDIIFVRKDNVMLMCDLTHHNMSDTESSNVRLIVEFEAAYPHVFKKLWYKKVPYRDLGSLNSKTLISDWVNLLKHSGIYYIYREFNTKTWSTYWIEFPCFSSTHNKPVAIEIAYSHKTHQVFDVDSTSVNGE